MKKNRIIHSLNVENVAAEGRGIARHEGKVIFIDGAIPGDKMDVQLYKSKKDYALARPANLIEGSEERTEPFCIHFENCGGCKWQHLQYEHQLKYKQQLVVDAFRRIGKLEVPEVAPILGSPKTRFYRNKLEFTFSNKKWLTYEEIKRKEEFTDRDAVGFHIAGAFDKVLDIEECWLQDNLQNKIRNEVRRFAKENDYTFFDIREQVGLLRNMIIRTATTGEVMVVMVFHQNDTEKVPMMMEHLKNQFPQITSLQYVINPKRNDTIFDLDIQVYNGEAYILEQLGDFKFKIGPKSFFQTNSFQANQLYQRALELAEIQQDDVVYDLYTGTGTIAIYMAPNCKKVVGIEQIPEAIEDAHFNAHLNNIQNTTFYAGDMKDVLNEDFVFANGKPDVIITDPPRAGMHPDVVDVILNSETKRVVYISCNPSTQARDIQLLNEKYELQLIQPVDMFPHTYHIENIALLTLKKGENN